MTSLQEGDEPDHRLDQNASQAPSVAQHSSRLPPNLVDVEKHETEEVAQPKKSVYAGLGWLDRLLVLWILLAIIVGILLGNFVDDIGPALQKGKFVDVSVPIGKHDLLISLFVPSRCSSEDPRYSYRSIGDDVPNSLQSQVRNAAPPVRAPPDLDTTRFQHRGQLDHCTFSHGTFSPLPTFCLFFFESLLTEFAISWVWLGPSCQTNLIFESDSYSSAWRAVLPW